MKEQKNNEEELFEAIYNIGVTFLGKNFLQGNTTKDFIRDTLRLGVFIFSPIILLGVFGTITILLERLLG